MPEARLICHDFSQGLPEKLAGERFDVIVCTYAIHHLDEEQKIGLIEQMLSHLEAGGRLYIGDVAFATRQELEVCREASGRDWDEEESYPVAEEIASRLSGNGFPQMHFRRFSFCAGVMYWQKEN